MPGLAPLDLPTVVADIRAAREVADVVVPYFHWGMEYTLDPTARPAGGGARRRRTPGASLVLGSHPHWVQSVEFYRGAFIAYSLGNFVFDQDWSIETQQGVIVRSAWRNGALVAVDLRPIDIQDLHAAAAILLTVDRGGGATSPPSPRGQRRELPSEMTWGEATSRTAVASRLPRRCADHAAKLGYRPGRPSERGDGAIPVPSEDLHRQATSVGVEQSAGEAVTQTAVLSARPA